MFLTEVTPPVSNLNATSYGDIQLLHGGGITTRFMPNNIAESDRMIRQWDPGTVGRDGRATVSSVGIGQWYDKIAAARSYHVDGVNVCMGDGSVHFIMDMIPQRVWGPLANGGDGRTVELP